MAVNLRQPYIFRTSIHKHNAEKRSAKVTKNSLQLAEVIDLILPQFKVQR
jgi:hypothetical protein